MSGLKKKIISLFLTALLCLTCLVPAFAEEMAATNTVAGKLEIAENFLYGAVQTGSLVSRVDKMETDMYGQKSSGSVMTRVDNLYNNLEGAPVNGKLSMATMMNVIEWQFSDRMSTDAAKTRLGTLETQIFGTEYAKDSYTSRLNRLTKAAFPNGSLTSSTVVLPKDSLIKVKFMQDINSKTNQQGDTIDFIVDDNVYVGDALVLPKGAKGYGQIKKIVQPRIFGRDARIDLDFSHVVAVNGGAVPVTVGDLAKQQAKTAAGAAGASIGGMILFGPVGVVGGAFVKGSSVTIPAGTNTYVQVAEDTSVDGVILAGSAVAGQQLDGNTQEGGPQTAQPASAVTKETAGETAAEPAAEAQKEPAAAPQPKKNTGVALDETEPEAAQPADDSQTVQEPAAKTGEDKADAETEAALAEAQKRDEEAKKLAKKDSSSQPMLDEDDGSAYDTATL
ncbi:hypothetical protein [uncultured Acidaminococcus sp.]|uniref:hypothetical protein n=1 Tax=uncultured Acidaminococcus sp. TaxID=352152 RepID=UPI00265E8952|nr:hypothetical protein [uncultured Acidaminococcus sp.]